jgi:ADP-ribose pyrophosphatase
MDLPQRYQDYLDFTRKYPKYLSNKGNCKKGEIETVVDIELFPKCEESAAGVMMSLGIPEKDAIKRSQIGVFDQSRWGITIHEPLKLPDGSYTVFSRSFSWSTLESGSAGVVTVPITADERYIFIKTYRNATKNWCLEFPRGGKDPGDSILKTLKKELSEEMGAQIIEDPKKIGEVFPDSAILASRVDIFLVKVKITGLADHEAAEAIRGLVFVPKSKIIDLLKTQEFSDTDGKKYEFKDGFTLSALGLCPA